MSRLATLVIMICLAMAANAGPDDKWMIHLWATDSSNGHALFPSKYGTNTTTAFAVNSYIPSDYAAIYCEDRGGVNPWWSKDVRLPLETGESETWHLTLTAGTAYPFGQIKLAGWNIMGTEYDLGGQIPVRLIVASDPSWPDPGSYAPGTTLWTFDPELNGTDSHPTYTALFNWENAPIHLELVAGGSSQQPVVTTIGQARTTYAGQAVRIDAVVATSAPSDSGGLWVGDGSSGLMIAATWTVATGDRLSVTGVVSWQDGVPVMNSAELISQSSGSVMQPRFTGGHSLANDPTESLDYRGINPVGLFVAACGEVTAADSQANVFYIDDGSRLQDGTGPSGAQNVGLRIACKAGASVPAVGSHVRIAGIRTVSKVVLANSAYVNGAQRQAGEMVYIPVVSAVEAAQVIASD